MKELAKLRELKNGDSASNVSTVKHELIMEIKELENRLIAAISTAHGKSNEGSGESIVRNPLKNPLNQRGDS